MTDERRQELEGWTGDVLSPSEELYERYMAKSVVRGQVKALVAHAWLHAQDEHLAVKIPAVRIMERWGIEDGNVELQQLALSVIDLDGPKSLMMISAKDAPYEQSYTENVQVDVDMDEEGNYIPVFESQEKVRTIYPPRKLHTTADDLHIWITELEPFGYTIDDIKTDVEMKALLPVIEGV